MKTSNDLKWGLVGLGNIAHQFAQDLLLVRGVKIHAAASRSLQKTKEFCSRYGIPHACGSYDELFADPDVDVVYIATPHNSHCEWSLRAMEAGKHVVCEKPLAVNGRQVDQLITASAKNGVFLLEGLWSRYNPSIAKCLDLIREGAIGQVNYVNADFCFNTNAPPESRLLNLDLAGGSLLDIGIYPLFLAYCIFGLPQEIKATARFHQTGVDAQMGAVLKYDKGLASVNSGLVSRSDMVARISGTKGELYLDSRWHEAPGFTLVRSGHAEEHRPGIEGNGFTYEIREVLDCIRRGAQESSLWSHQNSRDLMAMMDEIRRQIGLKYPGE